MADHLKQKVKFCKKCNRDTIHIKNGKKTNWVLQSFLIVITAGLWLIPLLATYAWRALTTDLTGRKGWTCDACGSKG